MTDQSANSLSAERLVAPGTRLREAVEIIKTQQTGALVVLGDRAKVEPICTGGFDLVDAPFTPQRLAELSKMDGAIVVDAAVEHILKANVHLIPDPALATDETGTRQRTAERVARQTGFTVISISEVRGTATVFTGSHRYELQSPTALLAQANQTVQSMERMRRRLEASLDDLTRVEVEDVATFRDAIQVLQRAALTARLGRDLERSSVELGRDGALIALQAADLMEGVQHVADLVYLDYARRRPRRLAALERLASLPRDDLYDIGLVASSIGFASLDGAARPRGYRALAQVPRLPDTVKDALVKHFREFPKLLHATVAELHHVEGVGRARAEQLRHYLDQLVALTPAWDFSDDAERA